MEEDRLESTFLGWGGLNDDPELLPTELPPCCELQPAQAVLLKAGLESP